jgi:hypothetical protein
MCKFLPPLQELKKHMSQAGDVNACHVDWATNKGVVEFVSREGKENAIRELDNTEVQSSRIRVKGRDESFVSGSSLTVDRSRSFSSNKEEEGTKKSEEEREKSAGRAVRDLGDREKEREERERKEREREEKKKIVDQNKKQEEEENKIKYQQRLPCIYFNRRGGCRHGDKCHLGHFMEGTDHALCDRREKEREERERGEEIEEKRKKDDERATRYLSDKRKRDIEERDEREREEEEQEADRNKKQAEKEKEIKRKKSRPCKDFQSLGGCPRGNKCHFGHFTKGSNHASRKRDKRLEQEADSSQTGNDLLYPYIANSINRVNSLADSAENSSSARATIDRAASAILGANYNAMAAFFSSMNPALINPAEEAHSDSNLNTAVTYDEEAR